MTFKPYAEENVGKTRRIDVFFPDKQRETYLFTDEREERLFLARHDFGKFDYIFFMGRVNDPENPRALFDIDDYLRYTDI